ncbi:bifunctional [glutamate--ammonia ligase]-adenylyl-L-tyrosine phosphorylase/[glutamate--ammonia-ligase] adenylyltransferase [Paraglaciecola sp. MB-3u-78]|uniref:bifunctional [glutamate--ammonia ligase]-adenylyl-L-tyrosine phosphorylase/[glutamate--ammonia-ligase] adenylyltransferase n=1 Tax=Paraglaciecola sp. MB-3u-78 TaxID=2058332 RepID=UPI000C326EF5|nr:bifunctional [glutamate--ammonia ligase]-adenylyl-L-tyrosine phosphorylase/[glutamate--ammonia-ligase] adenylyltransferase [Paraglaciecola sp. MB-3u-78]PKG93409.1 bifunctional [glutamate--ammonia ligase]-adenylyl-L-tyrosine phosphorylase/[glutamate--ammonia-ligase] adenylyltransferase [Paraglaciecola sp. MB-3u-78]
MNENPSTPLPKELIELGNQRWQELQSHEQFSADFEMFEEQIKMAFSLSEFISEQCIKYPSWIAVLFIEKLLFAERIDYQHKLTQQLAEIDSEAVLHQKLRQFRNFHMLRIAWRDLLNMQSIEDSLAQVSELARQLITQTNNRLCQLLQPQFGLPEGEFGPQPLLILGMGKLGGGELNFSSDIDLIFTYPAVGVTSGGKKSLENQQFFTKLAQKIITALDQITADGQVYRVDMRLRPFGDSGPLVMHFDAMEDYYQEQGRDWERYAMLKASILNQPCPYTKQLSDILQPFIYRRYLDFSAIESLRSMKSMIEQEVRRRGLTNNIKLGKGGIREAEFIVQSLQLINGGREPSLKVQSLQLALSELVNLQILPAQSAKDLQHSYLWLRKIEHCLQQFADKQTQVLPNSHIDQKRLLYVLGMTEYEDFMQHLAQHCDLIHQQFSLLVKEDPALQHDIADEQQQGAKDLWQLQLNAQETQSILNHWHLADAELVTKRPIGEDVHQQVSAFKQDLTKQRIGQRGLTTLNNLMPVIIHNILSSSANDHAELFRRVLTVLHAILGRTAYLQLLYENQAALFHLVKLCAASPWVTEQIARFPLLLDELLNPISLYQPVAFNQYADELRQALLRVEPEDLELQIETLRQFKLSQQLKIAASDISNALPVMQVSDHLTYLAEAIIVQVVDIAWQQMVVKHGVPVCDTQGPKNIQNKGFAVLGFGKLGGWELGYGSDLDLVFLHNCDGQQLTNGKKPIGATAFYIKLAQRILHIFTIKTGLGLLYDVDMRLRPSGHAGLLVCHVNGFATYETENAWTWEHQALGRARFILGCSELQERFSAVRLTVLSKPRVLLELANEVVSMREKMRAHLAKGDAENIDLKQDAGGIADIEFIVQFMLLAHTSDFPSLAKWPDNVRILADLAALSLMTKTETDTLSEAYLEYRNYAHRLALQNATMAAINPSIIALQTKVKAIWNKYLT